jgi:hypothetical protein
MRLQMCSEQADILSSTCCLQTCSRVPKPRVRVQVRVPNPRVRVQVRVPNPRVRVRVRVSDQSPRPSPTPSPSLSHAQTTNNKKKRVAYFFGYCRTSIMTVNILKPS